MANQVVKVRRETIAACMTCPLCNKLYREATTIIECLHTFCRKCIYKKISDEELERCPICNINLGSVPLEKLRPDHNLQDVRAKIFPLKRRMVKAPEVVPTVTLPARRKERSLSSLVSTPRVSTKTTMTRRRTKGVARKAANLRGSFSIEKAIKKEEESGEDHPESSSSPETLLKFSQNTRQSACQVEPNQSVPNKGKEKESDPSDGKFDVWKPLHCLVEVANRSKSSKSDSQGSDAKIETAHYPGNEGQSCRAKIKENKRKLKVEDGKNNCDTVSLDNSKAKKLRRVRRKREEAFRESFISPQAVVDAAGGRHDTRTSPIWFSLVASKDLDGDAPLPQISSSYLRIKDGSMPVSSIQKYLMRKLDLTSEAEVEIKCMGKPVVPTLPLCNVVDLWLQSAPTSQRISTSVGSSAKEFVMVLAYSRKVWDS